MYSAYERFICQPLDILYGDIYYSTMHPDKEDWQYKSMFTSVITLAVSDAKGNNPWQRASAVAWLFRESEGLDNAFDLADLDIAYWRPVIAKQILKESPEIEINDQLLKLLLYFSKKSGGGSYPSYSRDMAEISPHAG